MQRMDFRGIDAVAAAQTGMTIAEARAWFDKGAENTTVLKTMTWEEQIADRQRRDERGLKKYEQEQIITRKNFLQNKSLVNDTKVLNLRFDSFEPVAETLPWVNQAKAWAKRIIKEPVTLDKSRYFMFGKQGAGKTWLSASILNAVNDFSNPQKTCLFISAVEMAKIAPAATKHDYGPHFQEQVEKWEQVMQAVKGTERHKFDFETRRDKKIFTDYAQVIVLDELGKEDDRKGYFGDLLFTLSDAIHEDAVLIVNSNLTVAQLAEKYDKATCSRLLSSKNLLDFRELPDIRFMQH